MKQLKSKPGVYMILNLHTGVRYIGGTTRPLGKRWAEHRCHLTAGKHRDDHPLQKAWNDLGEGAFRFVVLENTTSDESTVREREQFWIDHFKAQDQELYNRCPSAFDNTGLVMPDDIATATSARFSRFWEENPDKKAEMAAKLSRAWRDNPKKKKRMIQKQEELWADPERREQMLSNRSYSGPYTFIAPDGTRHHVDVLSPFCREHGLDPSTMSKIHREVYGKKSHKGWTKG